MSLLILLIELAAIVILICFILPQMPRWVRVGFWAVLTIINILNDDAFFAALSATIATVEWYNK